MNYGALWRSGGKLVYVQPQLSFAVWERVSSCSLGLQRLAILLARSASWVLGLESSTTTNSSSHSFHQQLVRSIRAAPTDTEDQQLDSECLTWAMSGSQLERWSLSNLGKKLSLWGIDFYPPYKIFLNLCISMLKLCMTTFRASDSPYQQYWCIMGAQYLLVEQIDACGADTGDKGKKGNGRTLALQVPQRQQHRHQL